MSHDHVAANCTDQSEGDDNHDNEGLNIGAQWDGEQGVNDAERDDRHQLQALEYVGLLAGFAFKRPGDANLIVEKLVHHASSHRFFGECANLCFELAQASIFEHIAAAFEVSFDQVELCDCFVGIGGDIDHAATVDARNRRVAFCNGEVGHLFERDFAAVGRADAQLLEVFHRAAFIERVAHHYFNIVATALDALRFDSVKGGAHLATEIALTQTERLSRWVDLKLDFSFAATVIVLDVEQPFVSGELGFDTFRSGSEFVEIAPRELNIDRHADAAGGVGAKGKFFGPRNRADELAPAAG